MYKQVTFRIRPHQIKNRQTRNPDKTEKQLRRTKVFTFALCKQIVFFILIDNIARKTKTHVRERRLFHKFSLRQSIDGQNTRRRSRTQSERCLRHTVAKLTPDSKRTNAISKFCLPRVSSASKWVTFADKLLKPRVIESGLDLTHVTYLRRCFRLNLGG